MGPELAGAWLGLVWAGWGVLSVIWKAIWCYLEIKDWLARAGLAMAWAALGLCWLVLELLGLLGLAWAAWAGLG